MKGAQMSVRSPPLGSDGEGERKGTAAHKLKVSFFTPRPTGQSATTRAGTDGKERTLKGNFYEPSICLNQNVHVCVCFVR